MVGFKQALVGTAVAAVALVGASPAWAGGSAPVSKQALELPLGTPRGSTFTVKGHGCVLDGQPGLVSLLLDDTALSPKDTTPDAAGDWAAEVVVSATAPVGRYEIGATCLSQSSTAAIHYDKVPFSVTATAATPSSTTSTTKAPAGTTAVRPATAVRAKPTFTG